jgi:3-oxoadipate CoA-transferase alpha subunit
MDKQIRKLSEAVEDVPDGATIMIGGFAGVGLPLNLVRALVSRQVRDLSVISNAATEIAELAEAGCISKAITTFVTIPKSRMPYNAFEEQCLIGQIELEMIPQGVLPERIRAAGVGIAGFYSPVGIGTFVENGKETKVISGKKYILESALSADYALIKAYKGDKFGNLTYNKSARNINPVMAMAAKTTIAEVEEIVDVGELNPEVIVTPGIFVDRIVQAEKLNSRI